LSIFPLSSYQKDLYHTHEMFPNAALLNVGGYMEFSNQVELNLLDESINSMIEVHDSLRIVITSCDDKVQQTIIPFEKSPIPVQDFSNAVNPSTSAINWMKQQSITAVPLELRKKLCQLNIVIAPKDKVFVFIRCHHLILDGWSFTILCKTLYTAYSKRVNNEIFKPELFSYKLILDKEKKYRESIYKSDQQFWSDYAFQNSICFNTNIPYKLSNSLKSLKNVMSSWTLSNQEQTFINNCTANNNVSDVHLFLAAFCKFLFSKLGLKSLLVGIPVLNRSSSKERSITGLFANVLPLAVKDSEESFIIFANNLGRDVKTIYRHCQLATSRIFECTSNKTSIGRLDCSFSYEVMEDRFNLPNNQVDIKAIHCGEEEYPVSIIVRKKIKSGETSIIFSCQDSVQSQIGCINSMATDFISYLSILLKR
jgi:hypothetical protein